MRAHWKAAPFVLALICGLPVAHANAQVANAIVVTSCGTQSYTSGQPAATTQDQTGKSCVNATVSASVAVAPVTTTSQALTVTTGNTFQSVLASNSSRNGCLIQNPIAATETLFVFFGANASATTGKSIGLGAGSAVSCAVGGLAVATDNISVTAATTGHAFVVTNQ